MNKFIMIVCCFTIHFNMNAQEPVSDDELTGKGNPELFGNAYKLRKEAYECFLQMKKDAAKEGINITVASAYRSYAAQKGIWERKYVKFVKKGLSPEAAIGKIIEYSTIPGTSRHHWGTEVDIIDGSKKVGGDVLVAGKFEEGGPFYKLKSWMDKNAYKYGFYLVYTNESHRKGFKYEPWHYSFAPLSVPYLQQYKKIDVKTILLKDKLKGIDHFTGDFLERYYKEQILDINPELL